MPTCNRLDLESLGDRLYMPKYFPGHMEWRPTTQPMVYGACNGHMAFNGWGTWLAIVA